jgi:hypothetical protein
MSTNAVPLPPQLPRLKVEPDAFGLYNPSPEFIDVHWGGKNLRLPGCKDISRDPCRLDDETPIPGTLVIRDGYQMKPSGEFPQRGETFNWKAAEAIKHLLKVDPDTGTPTGPLSERGVTFVPEKLDALTLKAVQMDAEKRFGVHLVIWAERKVRNFEMRMARNKEAGMNPPVPDSDVLRAKRIQDEHFSSLDVSDESAAINESLNEEETQSALQKRIAEIAEAVASQVSADAAVDKLALAEKLMEDEEIRRHLSRSGYSVRKRGHLPEDAKEPKKKE